MVVVALLLLCLLSGEVCGEGRLGVDVGFEITRRHGCGLILMALNLNVEDVSAFGYIG